MFFFKQFRHDINVTMSFGTTFLWSLLFVANRRSNRCFECVLFCLLLYTATYIVISSLNCLRWIGITLRSTCARRLDTLQPFKWIGFYFMHLFCVGKIQWIWASSDRRYCTPVVAFFRCALALDEVQRLKVELARCTKSESVRGPGWPGATKAESSYCIILDIG
jgi:hypothetical protein